MISNRQTNSFPKIFWVANTMEIFERLAWYGFFTLSSLYMTTPVEQGGVGFSETQRGALQGIIPFFLYVLPVITGALGDRFGYRKMFIVAFLIMTPSYYLLGQVTSFWGFFAALSAVALGAACFKPIVVGTIGHATNDKNRGLGFGIFYTMVNIGGFIGPLVAGYVRAISWDAVFVMSALWIALNFIPAIFLYKDPPGLSQNKPHLKQVFKDAQQVLGNSRFALLLFPCILALMGAGVDWYSYTTAALLIVGWIAVNLVWNRFSSPASPIWWKQPIKVSNMSFTLYLAILTGFWTIYNQLFYTLPLFIRDYVDTRDLVILAGYLGQGAVEFLAHVDIPRLSEKISQFATLNPTMSLESMRLELVHLKVNVPVDAIQGGMALIKDGTLGATELANQWKAQYRQINPEYMINLDFAAIILLQIGVSYVCQFFKTLNVLVVGLVVMVIGMLVALVSDSLAAGGMSMLIVILGIAFSEMLTSPKSQEYVASIAPSHQTALYMGYYFICMALGYLFGGFLSGWSYGTLTKEMGRPDLMWSLFGAIALLTCLGLIWFNRRYIKHQADDAMPSML